MPTSSKSSTDGIVRVHVDSNDVLFTTASYSPWLEANGFAFIQQKHTQHGELVYATSFEDLIPGETYTSVKMPLHSLRVGVDSLTNRGVNDSLQEVRQEIARANGKVDQFISLCGGTFITLVVLLGLLGLFQVVKRRFH